MYCIKCGTANPEDALFCSGCGVRLETSLNAEAKDMDKQEVEKNKEAVTVERKRAGFITFWLWLGIIANVISAPFSIIQVDSMSNLGEWGIHLIVQGVDIAPFSNSIGTPVALLLGAVILSAVFNIGGYALLLKWKKKGFLIIVIAAIINIVLNLISYPMIEDAYLSIGLLVDYSMIKYITLVGTCLSLFVLWAILQIKKGGVSCWSQLK